MGAQRGREGEGEARLTLLCVKEATKRIQTESPHLSLLFLLAATFIFVVGSKS